jgi:hypothetical protein
MVEGGPMGVRVGVAKGVVLTFGLIEELREGFRVAIGEAKGFEA